MDKTQQTLRIKQQAAALGFDLVGLAPAEPSETADRYEDWLAKGYAGEMAYLSRPDAVAKRRDPRRIWPAVRSLVVVGLNYYTLADQEPSWSPTGVIARYAWGQDYHEWMGDRLGQLAEFIQELAGADPPPKVYVDTGPLLEREIAARAGLGWFGKNTHLLNQRWGSWFFLGEVLTSLELAYDEPVSAHCGSCTRCLAACPTGALVAPYVLDARRCISYLTMELKGPIPRELRPRMGNRIFGCDVCQEVCPWNRKHARPTAEPAFQPRAGLAAPELIPWLRLTPEGFQERFRGSPIRRAKRRGLLRNVCVALGNSGDPAAVPALTDALRDPEPLVRGHAAWALGQLGGEGTRQALAQALAVEREPWVRTEIRAALLTARTCSSESPGKC